jgi:hypoxia up-regulated 1
VKRTKTTERTRNVPINFEEELYTYKPLSKTQQRISTRKLEKFDEFEAAIRKLAEAKNKLETFIYQTRDFVIDEYFIKASTEAEREAITQQSQEDDEWLYSDEAAKANFSVFDDRLAALQRKVSPVVRRIEEYQNRPLAVNRTVTEIYQYWKKLDKLNKTMPWLTTE